MALLGALAIITGYPIIQIERGWATVIAGSTLLAGGIVTVVLGLLLRAIMDVRTTLANAAFASPSSGSEAFYDSPHTEPNFGEPEHAAADHAPGYGAAIAATAVAIPVAALAMAPRREPEPDTHEAEGEPAPAAHEPVGSEHHDESAVPVVHERMVSPPMDDWLDKAFADLALEKTPTTRRDIEHVPSVQADPEQLASGNAVALHEGDVLYAEEHEAAHAHDAHPEGAHAEVASHPEHAHAEHDPAPVDHDATHEALEHDEHVASDETEHPPVDHHLEPMTLPAPVASTEPAVIGRYEADGTAYTMFADGSIEAQSDAGIYRFASMADLKAFIEG